jgi:hypothetical protein
MHFCFDFRPNIDFYQNYLSNFSFVDTVRKVLGKETFFALDVDIVQPSVCGPFASKVSYLIFIEKY